MPFDDLTGRVFGRLTVIGRSAHIRRGARMWSLRCECGTVIDRPTVSVSSGHTKSCGCLKSDLTAKRSTKHGGSYSREYRIWANMLTRCNNPKGSGFDRYGARGVRVCDAWHTFAEFIDHMGPCPSPTHSIDRIDNERGYEPGNVRWASDAEQRRNQKRAHVVTIDGVSLTVGEWSRLANIGRYRLYARVHRGANGDELVSEFPQLREVARKARP